MIIARNDNAARDLFGQAYDQIPKSIFAVAAYYLADVCSEAGVGNDQAIERLREEFKYLGGQVIDANQAKRAEAALARLEKESQQ